MAIPTISECYQYARKLCGDSEIPGGQRFDDSYLQPFMQTAYSEFFSACLSNDLPLIERRSFPILPAYTAVLYPATAKIANFGELILLSNRGSLTQATITGVTTPAGGACTVTTSGAHGFLSGQRITHHGIVGLSDDINDEWMITYLGPSTYQINGTTATGTYASGGVAVYSPEEYSEIVQLETIPSGAATNASSISNYAWSGDSWRFPGCSSARQLKIQYQISGVLPDTADTTSVDGIKDFLAYRCASLALINDNPEQGGVYQQLALGEESGRNDLMAIGGFLGQLLRPAIRASQRIPTKRPDFRPPRNTARRVLGWW